MKKKPYTTETLFNAIVKLMKKEGTLLDILDYHLPTSRPEDIKNYQFDIVGDLAYGSNEGIYLSMFIRGYHTKEREYKRVHIGTFKTLRDDRNALKYMGAMMADFIYVGTKFVNDNIDDFDFPIELPLIKKGK